MTTPAVKPLILLSAGGTASDVLGFIHDINARGTAYRVLGYLDDAAAKQGTEMHGLPVLGCLQDAARFAEASFVNCLGSPSNFWHRGPIVDALQLAPNRFETLIHPSATVAQMSDLAPGTIVYPHVFVGTGVKIGRQALVMSHTSINHDVTIGDYAIVATGAILLGKVNIGALSYVGAGASIRQNLSVGRRSLVGMGSVVVRDVPDNVLVMGVPARYVRPIGAPAAVNERAHQ